MSEKENINNNEHNIEETSNEELFDESDNIIEENNLESTENRKDIKENKNKSKNVKKYIISAAIFFVIIIIIAIYSIINKFSVDIYPNIYLENKKVSGLNSVEIDEYISELQQNLKASKINIMQGDINILEIVSEDIDFKIDKDATEEELLAYGRDGNIFKNNLDIFRATIFSKKLNIIYKYDSKKLSDILKEIKESIVGKTIDDSFTLDAINNKIIIVTGKSGISINIDETKKDIIKLFASGSDSDYIIKLINTNPQKLDIDVVYSQVFKEPKDAYISEISGKKEIVPHEVGYDFDKEELRKVLEDEKNLGEGITIEYPLTVKNPNVLTNDIAWDFFEYQISSYTTYFSTADPNRVNNLKVALQSLNGKIIKQGETFSFNNTIGAATEAQGYKAAATFVGGRVVREIGGGICQSVSTLYNVALLANMEIVQRKAHSLPVAYVPESRDATVYYPSIDFKFKNNREYPVKILTYFNANGSLTISLYGTKQDNEYEITITSQKLYYNYYNTIYTQNPNMLQGEQQVTQNGSNGYTSEAYITKKLNGIVVEYSLLSRDTYKAVSKYVTIGTMEPTVVSTEPESTEQVTEP